MSLPFSGGDICIIAAGKREHMALQRCCGAEKIRGETMVASPQYTYMAIPVGDMVFIRDPGPSSRQRP